MITTISVIFIFLDFPFVPDPTPGILAYMADGPCKNTQNCRRTTALSQKSVACMNLNIHLALLVSVPSPKC